MGRYTSRTPKSPQKSNQTRNKAREVDNAQLPDDIPVSPPEGVRYARVKKARTPNRSSTKHRASTPRRNRRGAAGVKLIKSQMPTDQDTGYLEASPNTMWLDCPRTPRIPGNQVKRTSSGTHMAVCRGSVNQATPQLATRARTPVRNRVNTAYVLRNNSLYGFNGGVVDEKVDPVNRYPAVRYEPVPRPEVTVELNPTNDVDMSEVKFSSEIKINQMSEQQKQLARMPKMVFKPMESKKSSTSGHDGRATPPVNQNLSSGSQSGCSREWPRAVQANRSACITNVCDPIYDGDVMKKWGSFDSSEIEARMEIARIDAMRMSGQLENDYVRELRRLNFERQRDEEKGVQKVGVQWSDQ